MSAQNQLLYPDLSYKVRGCFFKVYNVLGFGHKESVYHKALAKEFNNSKLKYEEEKNLQVSYRGEKVGNYRPDFVIENIIIIEIKALEYINKIHEMQLLHYLKSTGYKLGFLVNFGSRKLDICRRIWTPQYPHISATIREN